MMEERRADVPKGAIVETMPGGLRITWPTFGSRWKYAILFFLLVVSLPAAAVLLLLSVMPLVAGASLSSYGENCGDLGVFRRFPAMARSSVLCCSGTLQ